LKRHVCDQRGFSVIPQKPFARDARRIRNLARQSFVQFRSTGLDILQPVNGAVDQLREPFLIKRLANAEAMPQLSAELRNSTLLRWMSHACNSCTLQE
jgi:hypothetical protein